MVIKMKHGPISLCPRAIQTRFRYFQFPGKKNAFVFVVFSLLPVLHYIYFRVLQQNTLLMSRSEANKIYFFPGNIRVVSQQRNDAVKPRECHESIKVGQINIIYFLYESSVYPISQMFTGEIWLINCSSSPQQMSANMRVHIKHTITVNLCSMDWYLCAPFGYNMTT